MFLLLVLGCRTPPVDTGSDTGDDPGLRCDGEIAQPVVSPDGEDQDGDGYTTPADCDDTNPVVHPGAIDPGCANLDVDCDGETGTRGPAILDGRDMCLSDALTSMAEGGTLEVCPGHHLLGASGRIDVTDAVEVVGMMGSRGTSFDLGGSAPLSISGTHVGIRGLTVLNGVSTLEPDAGCLDIVAETVEVSDVQVEGCRGSRGALRVEAADATFDGVTALANAAAVGGGIYASASGRLIVRGVDVAGNYASYQFGGLVASGTSVDVDGLSINANSSERMPTGGLVGAVESLTLRNVEVIGPGLRGGGLLVYLQHGTAEISDVLLEPGNDHGPTLEMYGDDVRFEVSGLRSVGGLPRRGQLVYVHAPRLDLDLRDSDLELGYGNLFAKVYSPGSGPSHVLIEDSTFSGNGIDVIDLISEDYEYNNAIEVWNAATSRGTALDVTLRRVRIEGVEVGIETGDFPLSADSPDPRLPTSVVLEDVQFVDSGFSVVGDAGDWDGALFTPFGQDVTLRRVSLLRNLAQQPWVSVLKLDTEHGGTYTLDDVDFGSGGDANVGGADLAHCAGDRLGFVDYAVLDADHPCP